MCVQMAESSQVSPATVEVARRCGGSVCHTPQLGEMGSLQDADFRCAVAGGHSPRCERFDEANRPSRACEQEGREDSRETRANDDVVELRIRVQRIGPNVARSVVPKRNPRTLTHESAIPTSMSANRLPFA